jgi:predicted amidohydrolase
MLKISCVQLTSSADLHANILKIEGLVAKAAREGARLVATPENSFLIEEPGQKREIYSQNEHPGVKAASRMAKNHKIWLLIGSVAVAAEEEGKTYNRSLLFNPDGEIAAKYDKIHLFDVDVGDGQVYRESAKIAPGNEAVIASLPFATLGMTVCYDLRFPQLYRALAKNGANIIAVPAAFTQVTGEAHWHVLLRARAIETGSFIIAPAQVGTHAGDRKTYGHSLIVDPWGRIMADGGTGEGIITAELDSGEVDKIRAKLPNLKHDRDFTISCQSPGN